MGKLLGAYDSDELDRPDLNKCPDCGCFFAQDNCPLCGKVCPDEFRAGNRKPPKKVKRKSGGSSGRVTFVEWYHSWWVIILALLIFPIVGIILLATSPHKRSLKIALIVVAVIYAIISMFGIGNIIHSITKMWDKPVDTSLSREEYIQKCEKIDAEEFYRSAGKYEDKFVCIKLKVIKKFTDVDGFYYDDDYTAYYICEDENGGEYQIMIRDCIQDGNQNFVSGDIITVYGEGAGNLTVNDMNYESHEAPCVYVAYAVLHK